MPSPLELNVACGDGNTLCTSFRFERGRFRHLIMLRSSAGVVLDQWEDESNSGDEEWPASPPIQQLSLESINDHPTLLGVGQAGKSHWSISVERIFSETHPGLKFDLACRCRVQPVWLGSTYRRLLPLNEVEPRLCLIPAENLIDQTAQRVLSSCRLNQASSLKYPATFRWTYFVQIMMQ